jgi:dTMP kinase
LTICRSQIESVLNAGTTVVCDRYAFSGCAFTASKGLSYEWSMSPDVGLPAPDLVLFLDVSPEVAKQRGGYGEERYETEAMQKRVREHFSRLGTDFGDRWVSIDASGSLEAVENEIWSNSEPLTKGVNGPLTKLWTKP